VLDRLSDPESDIITASKDTGFIFLSEINDRVAIESIAELMARVIVVVDAIYALVKVY
jgi:hypothetical protein